MRKRAKAEATAFDTKMRRENIKLTALAVLLSTLVMTGGVVVPRNWAEIVHFVQLLL